MAKTNVTASTTIPVAKDWNGVVDLFTAGTALQDKASTVETDRVKVVITATLDGIIKDRSQVGELARSLFAARKAQWPNYRMPTAGSQKVIASKYTRGFELAQVMGKQALVFFDRAMKVINGAELGETSKNGGGAILTLGNHRFNNLIVAARRQLDENKELPKKLHHKRETPMTEEQIAFALSYKEAKQWSTTKSNEIDFVVETLKEVLDSKTVEPAWTSSERKALSDIMGALGALKTKV